MKNPFFNFLIICILSILLNDLLNEVLQLKELIYSSLAQRLTSRQIEEYFELQYKWKWMAYVLIPLLILIKVSLITSVLYIGTFFFSKKIIDFKQLWSIVIKAEFALLLVPIFKIIWFYFFEPNYNLEDLQYFHPLSALNIVGYKGLEPWLIYPFQIINLFELAYWLLLAYFIGKITETNMDRGLKIVASSYGSALLLWVAVIMFFTLNYS